MTAVFLDSVGLIALWDKSDQWHAVAEAAFRRLQASRRRLVTTRYVLLECGNAAQRRPFRAHVAQFQWQLRRDRALVACTRGEWDAAWHEYERRRPGDPGIVDCISFTVMRRLGLTDAFTNDQHFRAAGFNPLF